VANGIIGFMWNASQGSGYPYPHVRAARFNESTKAVIDQPVLWGSNFASIYPAVGVNARGHIAGPGFSGGGTSYPTLNVFVWDDLSPDPVTSAWETYVVATSTNGPTSNKWGDYLASRPQSSYPNTWIGTGYTLRGGGANSNARPRFVWFGRERDNICDPAQVRTNQLVGCLYDNTALSGSPQATAPSGPTLASPVPSPATALAIEWGNGGPSGTAPDTFSIRWKGNFTFPAGTYTFTVGADDGVRLKFDGTTRIDDWGDHPYRESSQSVALTGGSHLIEVEYYENGG
jgi:hypothetical protein